MRMETENRRLKNGSQCLAWVNFDVANQIREDEKGCLSGVQDQIQALG